MFWLKDDAELNMLFIFVTLDVIHPDRSGFAVELENARTKDVTVAGNCAEIRNCVFVFANAYCKSWSDGKLPKLRTSNMYCP